MKAKYRLVHKDTGYDIQAKYGYFHRWESFVVLIDAQNDTEALVIYNRFIDRLKIPRIELRILVQTNL